MSIRGLNISLGVLHGQQKSRNVIFYTLAFLLLVSFFASPSTAKVVNARSAVVIEASTGRVLWGRNPNDRLPPASTAKLMTAIVVMEKGDLSKVVTVSRHAALVQPMKLGFKKGDRITIEDLLYAALIRSANDAAVVLAEAIAGSEASFVQLMNHKAAEIGATNTRFINATGLPGPHQYITVLDLAKIMNHALRYPKLKEIIGTPVAEFSTESGTTLLLQSTNKLLGSDQALIGGKTGYTARAGHCFVCAAERHNSTIIVAVLGSPSRKHLWEETEQLIGKGFRIIATDRPAKMQESKL